MNNKILEKIKQDFVDIDKISKGDFSEITELEKNPIVQRYKYLLDIKNSYFITDSNNNQSHIFGEIINKYSTGLIEQTNNIWFWFLNMPVGKYEEIFSTSLSKTDKDSIIAVYMDLENSKKVITIPIDKQDDFESANYVIRGNRSIVDSGDRYYNARYEFFKLCVSGDQNLAVKMMLEEEISRAKNIARDQEQELKQLDCLLSFGVISEKEYIEKKQKVLLKR